METEYHTNARTIALTEHSLLDEMLASSPLLVTVQQACKMLACGKTTVFALINKGHLERRKIGSATRITRVSIYKYAGV